ncbi:MAG: DUF4343 domain-containing protein [Sphingobacteriales bacterium]|nr:MAG: DUF4343 domain-containing protein [Sphingobacteriales bacterium]
MLADINDLFELEQVLCLGTCATHVPAYDFNFRQYFETKSVIDETLAPLVLRVGAIADYAAQYRQMADEGIQLINTLAEHERASLLPHWYPLIEDLTPRSTWYESLPSVMALRQDFAWPVFIKGERQTNRHRRSLSVARNEQEYGHIRSSWESDPVLGWQRMICREFVPLRKIAAAQGDALQVSEEYRVFLWKGAVAGFGPYWPQQQHHVTGADLRAVKVLAETVAARVQVPFLVVDVARTEAGTWIVIELNDAQESGYAGVSRIDLWTNILALEKQSAVGKNFVDHE